MDLFNGKSILRIILPALIFFMLAPYAIPILCFVAGILVHQQFTTQVDALLDQTWRYWEELKVAAAGPRKTGT